VEADTATPRRIVVGVDRSDNAARAAAWAAREAVDRGASLQLVHALHLPGASAMVYEPPGFTATQRETGAKLLQRHAAALRELHPDLTVTTELSELDAPETLVALSSGAELVVVGTRGHGGFAGMLLGSVSLKLATHAHSPAVVVRGEDPVAPVQEIVLGVEPNEVQAPIRFAFESAAKLGIPVRAVRAWQAHPGFGGHADSTERENRESDEVDALLQDFRREYPDVAVSRSITHGNAVPVLIEAARGSRLLVVGAHRHHGPLSVGAGYVVHGLLSHAPTPVAVVPVS